MDMNRFQFGFVLAAVFGLSTGAIAAPKAPKGVCLSAAEIEKIGDEMWKITRNDFHQEQALRRDKLIELLAKKGFGLGDGAAMPNGNLEFRDVTISFTAPAPDQLASAAYATCVYQSSEMALNETHPTFSVKQEILNIEYARKAFETVSTGGQFQRLGDDDAPPVEGFKASYHCHAANNKPEDCRYAPKP